MILDGERGQSEVMGVVLILGITLATITVTLAVGAAAFGDAQSDSQVSAMENSMSQMSSKASLVALGETDAQRFDLGETGDGQVEVKPEAGNVRLIHAENNETIENGSTIYNGEFGAVVYELDGEQVAYQGGGVWKKEGDWSRMISPPEYHYHSRTLTFPIVHVTGEGAASGSVEGEFSKTQPGTSIYPNEAENRTNPVDDGTVYVEIESDYHHAWYEFFDSRTQGDVFHDPENRTVIADLTVPLGDSFDSPVTVTESDGIDINGNNDPPEDWRTGMEYPSASDRVDAEIAECAEDSCEDVSEPTLEGGNTYYTEDFVVGETKTFDTTDGDITLVIDGDFDIGNDDIEIDGENNVTVLLNGELSLGGQGEVNTGGGADQLIVYTHSDVERIDAGSGTPQFTGAIYAPNTKVELSGDTDFTGSVIAETARIDGNPSFEQFEYDESLAEIELDLGGSPDEIRYLHVSENTVTVELS